MIPKTGATSPDAAATAGLDTAEAARRLAVDGPNELSTARPRGAARLLRDVIAEPMFMLLAGCGAIYLFLGDRHEALMLLGFVIVVVSITFFQERRTERTLTALRDLSSPRALVIRSGVEHRVAGRELVCGDLVVLSEGDRVPADILLVGASNLMVDESLLTGESAPVMKHVAEPGAVATGPADVNPGVVYTGSLVTQGKAQGHVVATGADTALGRIGRSLQSIGTQATPIQVETGRIVRKVAILGLALATILVLAYGFSRGDWLRALLAGLTLAMAILPEELPVILTLFLGLGAWRLARERVLARSIPAVELLGTTTVLCVDKTGTLTTNRMQLRSIVSPIASFDTIRDANSGLPEELHQLLEFAVLASHRHAIDPMERAIGQAGARLLAETEHLHGDWKLVEDYPLAHDMLAMSRVWQSPDQSGCVIAAKGAPEAILDLCHVKPEESARVVRQVADLAAGGLRVLGVAHAYFSDDPLPGHQHAFEFNWQGLIGLEDPVRADVPGAIAECHAAGIRVVMMTGDHPATAMAVAREVGLATIGGSISGAELTLMNDAELQARLVHVNVFCRVQPEQKLRLVTALRDRGEVVGMTGDGVNDAPALKAAHIGVAMGARGTDVAREAAALVLLDDDFASIVTAVRYGRRVFANLRKAIAFVVAVHVPIVGLSIAPLALGWPVLLMPVHILFLQLIIDPACSIVFEAEPADSNLMRQPPRDRAQRLFDVTVLRHGLLQGLGLLVILLTVFAVARLDTGNHDQARALAFAVMVLSNLVLIMSNRTTSVALWGGRLLANPAYIWITLATIALLALVLTVPFITAVFAFAMPTSTMLALGLIAVLASLLWFEAIKAWSSA